MNQLTLLDADEGGVTTDHENEVTKGSGIVKKYSRIDLFMNYEIGQMKAFHGTKDIPAFKTKYKSLTGEDWSQSVCDVSEKQEKAAARGDYDPIHEEIDKCGSSRDRNSDNQCY